jgi:hypothetical protein
MLVLREEKSIISNNLQSSRFLLVAGQTICSKIIMLHVCVDGIVWVFGFCIHIIMKERKEQALLPRLALEISTQPLRTFKVRAPL